MAHSSKLPESREAQRIDAGRWRFTIFDIFVEGLYFLTRERNDG
jgi:hypothetical protein